MSTKNLHAPHGLPSLVPVRDLLLRRGADCERILRGREAINAPAMDRSDRTNQLHSRHIQRASHFPNGSRPRTSRKAPCWCIACRPPTSRAGSVGWPAASDSFRHDRRSRCRSPRYSQPAQDFIIFIHQERAEWMIAMFARLPCDFNGSSEVLEIGFVHGESSISVNVNRRIQERL